MYIFPSQDDNELDDFLNNFANLLNNDAKSSPLFPIIFGDLSARSISWWVADHTIVESTHLKAMTSFHGFQQLIFAPTYILLNSTSCTDHIFTDKQNLVVDSIFHSNFHHQIAYCKFNLNIEYLSPYKKLTWDYKRENSENIRKFIELLNWDAKSVNKNVQNQINIFNKLLRYFFCNFIPNKNVTFDNKDLPLMNELVKWKLKWKN